MKVCNLFCELLYQIITCTFVLYGIIRGAITNNPVRTIMAGFTTIWWWINRFDGERRFSQIVIGNQTGCTDRRMTITSRAISHWRNIVSLGECFDETKNIYNYSDLSGYLTNLFPDLSRDVYDLSFSRALRLSNEFREQLKIDCDEFWDEVELIGDLYGAGISADVIFESSRS